MKARLTRRRRARRGTTLIELMIALAVLGLVLGSVAMLGHANDRAYRTGSTAAHLEEQAVATVERLVQDLRLAGAGTLNLGTSSLDYLQAEGLDGSSTVWGGLRRLDLEYEVGEINDGLDNNGNGLVDEGCLVLTEDVGGPNERRRVLTRWVRDHLAGELPNGLDDNGNGLIDERGFVVEREGDTLVIRLTLERLDAEGRLMSRTCTTSVKPRN